MAHPDEGYIDPETIDPEERDPHAEWVERFFDPETGEYCYADDPYAGRRIALVRAQMERNQEVERREQKRRLEEFKKRLK